VLLACESDPALGRRIRAQVGERAIPPGIAAEILAEVRAAGGVARAREKALALADEAIAALDVIPPSPYRDALRVLARLSADRSS
jgi:octaprenyl-diphosphate synthase